MHLRRLEVHGFKAFADRQRFEFGAGMTGIIGPNGSGKSNVHDALRWVLGEQASRSIRARKTEDVIFSGSDQRRQMGSAEVTLALDNADGWMPIEFSEVTVTRRAYRNGENEYLINGQRVRLTDVLDLFRRAQVGQNSYAMMSQGLVDEVLALRPQERRELIEEAADVRRHRQQLTLSERRLSETHDNLGAVRMLIREVEPRLRSLERQSRKAERYRALQAQLHDALCVYYEQELRAAQDALAAGRALHDQQTEAFSQARTALERAEAELAERQATAADRRAALAALQTQERDLAEERLRFQQRVALAEQRLELLDRRAAELATTLAHDEQEAPPEAITDDGALEALQLRVAEAGTALDRERAALFEADRAARAVLRELAEVEAKRARQQAEIADAARRVQEQERRLEELDRERAQAHDRRGTLIARLRDCGQRALALRGERAERERTLAAARERGRGTEARMDDDLRALIEARDAVRVAEARIRQHEERSVLLEEIARQGGSAGGARAVLDAAQHAPEGEEPLAGIVGTVNQLLSVPSGLEAAIEAALAEQVATVIVEREQDALAAIEYLRRHGAGTATLLPLQGAQHSYPLNLFNERGVIGVAARLVRTDQRYRPLVDTLLGRTIVVEDLPTAQRMIRRGLGAVVTRDGVLLRPGGAYYGGREGAGQRRFALQSELEALPGRIAEARSLADAARARLAQVEQAVAETRAVLERDRADRGGAEDIAREGEQRTEALRREQAALGAELRVLHRTLAAARDERAVIVARAQEQIAREALERTAHDLRALGDRAEAVVAERDAVAERLTSAATRLAAAEGAQRAALEQREERAQARRRAQERRAQMQDQLAQARAEREHVRLALEETRERATEMDGRLTLAQAALEPARAALADASVAERDLSARRGELQARLLQAERATLQAESDLRERAQRLQTLRQQLQDEGLEEAADGTVRVPPRAASEAATPAASEYDSVDTVDAVDQPTVRGGAEVDLAALRERISELRAEIRALGPVNVDALEDLSEERERAEYLGGQVRDLEAAEVELRAAIEQLRTLIRERFAETFARVNIAFQDYFQRFFGGGAAALSLMAADAGEDGGGDPGVEITAQPPGKRIASLHVLSGGERALTSVALLFALLSVNPAPIVVLDEVDAALDEANVTRFVDTLRELCERSQFIVISHNRRTIEAADALYGVSMDADSTSRVLSLRLADLPQAS